MHQVRVLSSNYKQYVSIGIRLAVGVFLMYRNDSMSIRRQGVNLDPNVVETASEEIAFDHRVDGNLKRLQRITSHVTCRIIGRTNLESE
jgi:hypothetical protein